MLCQLFISNTHFLDRQTEPQRSNKEKRETSRVARPAGPPTGLPGAQEACGSLCVAPRGPSGPPPTKARPPPRRRQPPPHPRGHCPKTRPQRPRSREEAREGALVPSWRPPHLSRAAHSWATCGRLRHAPVPPPPPAGIHVPRRVGGPASRGKVLRRLLVQPCAIAPGTLRRAGLRAPPARLRAAVTEPGCGGGCVPRGLRT